MAFALFWEAGTEIPALSYSDNGVLEEEQW